MNKNKRFRFLNVELDIIDYEGLYKYVDLWISNKKSRSHHVAVINAHCVTMALMNQRIADIYNKADIAGPDGMPFLYWMRLFSLQKCDKIDAANVFEKLAERSKETKYTFYLYGGHPEVLKNMEKKAKELFPHINIIGSYSPPFRALTEKEDQDICKIINKLKPDIICVGLGTPKQDFWIDEHIEKIKGAVMVPCGAIFDFYGGRIKRAPRIIIILCLEWLYRLFSKDFKRLFYRYTVLNFIFLWNFFLQITRLRKFTSIRMIRPEI